MGEPQEDAKEIRIGITAYEEVGIGITDIRRLVRFDRPADWTDEEWDKFIAEVEKSKE
jgi:hypothetical protein